MILKIRIRLRNSSNKCRLFNGCQSLKIFTHKYVGVKIMKLKDDSIRWAIKHIDKEGDTDLFPKPIEIEIFKEIEDEVVNRLKALDIGSYKWNPSRRFVIPKSELSYRLATQLDPIDSIMLAAIIYEYGNLIESKRIPIIENRVFNYRFSPNNEGYLYDRDSAWKNFWNICKDKSNKYKHAVYLDISDFYNQIYHHVVENQLIYCGFQNEIKKSIMSLLESLTQKMSRGIPIGPHSVHLIAEMCLIPVDESLVIKGYEFCRFSDDIIIFCNDEIDAKIAVYDMAEILDKQQRLVLQKQKTKIYDSQEFQLYCEQMLTDNPINEFEEELLEVLRQHSTGMYVSAKIEDLSDEELKMFTKEKIEKVLEEYLDKEEPNYTRLRWFYRRLSQLGIPQAVEFSIKNMDKLIPVISDISQYFISVSSRSKTDLHEIGEDIFKILSNKLIASNEFLQISLVGIFSNSTRFNHLDKLIRLYKSSSENMKRKIIISAYLSDAGSWIRELKEDYPRLDIWSRRALAIAATRLPAEERKFYISNLRQLSMSVSEDLIIEWAKRKK